MKGMKKSPILLLAALVLGTGVAAAQNDVSALKGHDSKAPIDLQPIFDELQKLKRSPESATTQEKLWLTRAAAAMLRDGELGLGATGISRVSAKGAYSFRPSTTEIAAFGR